MKTNFKLSTPDEPKKFNLVDLSDSVISAELIPNLIPDKVLRDIQAGDADPYYKVQEIDISEPANGVMYTPEFWNSYLNKLKDRPIPGSKDGHHLSLYGRPPTDFYLVGGKLNAEKNTVYLKNYIPPDGDTTTNKGFIRDLKAGIIHFSIVAYTKDKIYFNEDGEIELIEAIESVKGERNDAVEYGLGAMTQKTNTKDPEIKPVKKTNTEVNTMDFKEILTTLKNLKANGEIDVNQVAKTLGIEVVTEEHKNAVKVQTELKKVLKTDNVVESVNVLLANSEKVKVDTFALLRNKKMTEAFGPEKVEDKDNLKRNAAELLVSKEIVEDKELDKQIEAAKANNLVMSFSYDEADENSKQNDLSGVEKLNKDKSEFSGEAVTI